MCPWNLAQSSVVRTLPEVLRPLRTNQLPVVVLLVLLCIIPVDPCFQDFPRAHNPCYLVSIFFSCIGWCVDTTRNRNGGNHVLNAQVSFKQAEGECQFRCTISSGAAYLRWTTTMTAMMKTAARINRRQQVSFLSTDVLRT